MATIEQRKGRDGKPTWLARVRLRGHPAVSQIFKNKTCARLWAQELESDVRAGRHLPAHQAHKHTFAELVDRYRKDVLPQYGPREQTKREPRLEWWSKRLGRYFLSDITPQRIAEAKRALAEGEGLGGKPAAPATQVRYLALLSHVLTHAIRELEWLDDNPARRVKRPKEPRGRVRFLDDDERERLLAACRTSSDRRLFPLVLLALSTGARQGELLRLRWPDLDLQRGLAVLHETKNGERRTLPLPAVAVATVKELMTVRRLGSDLVFADRKGKGSFPRSAWESALGAAMVEDFRYHDLRHSAASYLAMSGATLAEIADVLGHKTLQMVKRYAHLSDQHTSGVVARMAEKFLDSASRNGA